MNNMLFKKKINKDISDEELMSFIKKGNKEAFSLIYDRYADRMLKFFYFRLNNDNDTANDFVQDLFIKIIDKPELFDSGKCFSSWLFSLAHNMIKNEYKKSNNRNELLKLYDYDLITTDEHEFINREFGDSLERELKLIEPINRDIFKLRYTDELTIKEIAEITNIAEGTVKSKLFYTIKKLSEKLSIYNPKF